MAIDDIVFQVGETEICEINQSHTGSLTDICFPELPEIMEIPKGGGLPCYPPLDITMGETAMVFDFRMGNIFGVF